MDAHRLQASIIARSDTNRRGTAPRAVWTDVELRVATRHYLTMCFWSFRFK